MNLIKDKWVVILTLLALCLSAYLISNGLRRKPPGEYISVTGMSEQQFNSDQIVVNIDFVVQTLDMKSTYQKAKQNSETIKQFLLQKGLQTSEFQTNGITIQKTFEYETDDNGRGRSVFKGFSARQVFTLKSNRIDEVEKISKEAMELIESGIELNVSQPEFYYSKLQDLKLELIRKAAADAKARAEKIAESSNCSLGPLRKSNLGIFQITGEFENESFTYGGAFNTSNKSKKARITVGSSFLCK